MKNDIRVEVVLKGEKAVMPVNSGNYQWAWTKSKDNGAILRIGPRDDFGLFLPESKLQEIMARLQERIQEAEKKEINK
jgi:hypothetical protein